MKIEICIDDMQGLDAVIAAGADRIELCSALALGGLTPSSGLIAMAAQAPIPVYAMIRPRAGNFQFSRQEEQVMHHDIARVREAGLAGIVIGASLADGSLDSDLLARLMTHADGMGISLHRAFDLVPCPRSALQTAIELGFERILTSGGAPRAAEAVHRIKQMVSQAAERIVIMPGGGIDAGNAARIVAATGVREIHASCREAVSIQSTTVHEQSVALGFSSATCLKTSADKILQLRTAFI